MSQIKWPFCDTRLLLRQSPKTYNAYLICDLLMLFKKVHPRQSRIRTQPGSRMVNRIWSYRGENQVSIFWSFTCCLRPNRQVVETFWYTTPELEGDFYLLALLRLWNFKHLLKLLSKSSKAVLHKVNIIKWKNGTTEFQVSFLMFLCFLKKCSVSYKSTVQKYSVNWKPPCKY